MNLKTKLAKKALSWLISIIMIVPTISFNLSFSTFATQQQEVDFCLDKMKNLPTDDEFLKEMQKLPKEKDLNQSRHEDIFHADGSKNSVDLDERLIYKKIQKIVDDLKESIKIILSGENISDITTNDKQLLLIQFVFIYFLIFHLDISGKDDNDLQSQNILLIFLTLLVFHLDISGKNDNELQLSNIIFILVTL